MTDHDSDCDIDDLFGAFEASSSFRSHIPPVPLPLPSSHLKKRKSHDQHPPKPQKIKTEPSVHKSTDPNSPTKYYLEDDAKVLDQFSTEHEKIIGQVGGIGLIEGTLLDETLQNEDATLNFTKANFNTRHEVVIPPRFDVGNYIPMSQHCPPPMNKWPRHYPFTLDPFQEYAIWCIQRNESVLVAAHTSAGKTVVAEYAIAQALVNKQRVIYTSPIKALSNQKFRELQEEFGDVGLMTGDISINSDASCLVMTTEILRSMLYRGSEVLREISWVIFDEIHYMRDKDRGVVWEETLILLPSAVHFAFLSATIPNARQFAEWIAMNHKQPCHVVYTDYRPTPLQHYIFPSGSSGVHMVVDEKGNFREENFQKAMTGLAQIGLEDDHQSSQQQSSKGGNRKPFNRGKKGPNTTDDVKKVIRLLIDKNYHPIIVFSFVKRECESFALAMSKLDFNTDDEKKLVEKVFEAAVANLGEDDQKLPQITNMLPILRRGIGVHHSGLLPILKETIEILFQENLLKVLFATETFSIGLNMPAKTVVFTKIEKFDGKEIRHLSGGEYVQMAGRSGRRGLDDKGIVIMMVDQKIDAEKAKGMVKGESDPLLSAFRLGPNMILNLLRVEGMSPEYLIQHSFRQFQNNANLPKLLMQASDLEAVYSDMVIDDEDQIRSYYNAKYSLDGLQKDIHKVIIHPSNSLPFLKQGRIVQVALDDQKDGALMDPLASGRTNVWGIIVGYFKPKKSNNSARDDEQSMAEEASDYLVDVVLVLDKDSVKAAGSRDVHLLRPVTKTPTMDLNEAMLAHGEAIVVPVMLSHITSLSSVILKLEPFTVSRLERDIDARDVVKRSLCVSLKRLTANQNTVPMLDPVTDMKIADKSFMNLMERMKRYANVLKTHVLRQDPERLEQLYAQYAAKVAHSEQIRAVQRQIQACEADLEMEELKARKRILRRLGFTSESDVVEMKGRVAAEISTGDPLIITEMIFHGVFADLSVEEAVSVLGLFAFAGERLGKDSVAPKVNPKLTKPYEAFVAIQKRILTASKEANLQVTEVEELEKYKPEYMEIVYQWACGIKFVELCKTVDIFEGSLVRCFRLLEEMLKQVVAAARVIGNQDLEIKLTEGISKIKRDIVFANSLYL